MNVSNIRVYPEENRAGFSYLSSSYEPDESQVSYFDTEKIETITFGNDKFFIFKTKSHIKVGQLRYFGKCELYFIVFFPEKRRFLFFGVQENKFANIISVAKTLGEIDLTEIINKHRLTLIS